MKRIIIYFAALTLLLVNSCNKSIDSTMPEQFDRYIFFSHNVQTKASLFDSNSALEGFKYGVVGFKYSGTWEQYKATNPTPNVFYNNYNRLTNTEEVTCDASGYGSYAPLQGWSNALKYTFFAYYPYDNVSLLSFNGVSYVGYNGGSPYIYYLMDNSSNDKFKASMVDLMTGNSTNKDLTPSSDKISDGNVLFTFDHRMASLGVKATNSTSGTISIKSITLNLSDIEYNIIIVPLEAGEVTRQSITGTSYNASLPIDVPSGGISVSSTAVEVADKLILIPQETTLSIGLVVNYDRTVENYGTVNCENTVSLTAAALAEGKKYLIPLNFKESTVEVNGTLEGESWGASYTVNDTFN